MPALVPVPWQPHLYLTPHTLAYLEAASDAYGVKLYINSPDGAWRAYAQQLKYYLAWLAYRDGTGPKAPVASNPDVGQRNHMRGAAFDLILTSARVQAACRSVGLVRDSDESWHWNDPTWRTMPIIKSHTTTSSGGATAVAHRRKKKGKTMLFSYITDGAGPGKTLYVLSSDFTYLEFTGQETANQYATQFGAAGHIGRGFADIIKAQVESNRAALAKG